MEFIQLGLFWALLVGALATILVVGVVAGGVSYNRLERIAIDMSTDEESLSNAGKGLPYQPVNTRGLVGGLFRKLRKTGDAA
jgi:uncharacterized membrane protein